MFDIIMHKGLRLPRPVEVDWFKRLSKRRIEELRPGKFVWLIIDEHIQCAEIKRQSQPFQGKDLRDNGWHVFYSYSFHDGVYHEHHSMKLFRDTEKPELFRITDLCEAAEYFERLDSEPDMSNVTELKRVAGGGG